MFDVYREFTDPTGDLGRLGSVLPVRRVLTEPLGEGGRRFIKEFRVFIVRRVLEPFGEAGRLGSVLPVRRVVLVLGEGGKESGSNRLAGIRIRSF